AGGLREQGDVVGPAERVDHRGDTGGVEQPLRTGEPPQPVGGRRGRDDGAAAGQRRIGDVEQGLLVDDPVELTGAVPAELSTPQCAATWVSSTGFPGTARSRNSRSTTRSPVVLVWSYREPMTHRP